MNLPADLSPAGFGSIPHPFRFGSLQRIEHPEQLPPHEFPLPFRTLRTARTNNRPMTANNRKLAAFMRISPLFR